MMTDKQDERIEWLRMTDKQDERIEWLRTQNTKMIRAAMSHPQHAAYEQIKRCWEEALAIIDDLKRQRDEEHEDRMRWYSTAQECDFSAKRTSS